jgi:ribosomal protein S27AE
MEVEGQLGFAYEIKGHRTITHYQQVCPRCRRAMFGLAQAELWARD